MWCKPITSWLWACGSEHLQAIHIMRLRMCIGSYVLVWRLNVNIKCDLDQPPFLAIKILSDKLSISPTRFNGLLFMHVPKSASLVIEMGDWNKSQRTAHDYCHYKQLMKSDGSEFKQVYYRIHEAPCYLWGQQNPSTYHLSQFDIVSSFCHIFFCHPIMYAI